MSNERLRAAMVSCGYTAASLGKHVEVDTKTVERWISTARTPHLAHRMLVANALKMDDVLLWPEATSPTQRQSASEAEFIRIYPSRGSLNSDAWAERIEHARESIDIMAFAASFLHDTVPDFARRLEGRAKDGVRVRLLFGDPDGHAVRIRGDEEGIGSSLGDRCRLTWKYLKPTLDTSQITAKMHDTTLYQSIYRFDEDLFANTHIYGAPASQSPIVHVHRVPGGRLYANYLDGFERVWSVGTEVTGADLA